MKGSPPNAMWSFLHLVLGLSVLIGCGDADPSPSTAATRPADAVPAPVDRLIRVRLADQVEHCVLAVEGPFDVVVPATGERVGAYPAAETLTVAFTEQGVALPRFNRLFNGPILDLVPRSDAVVGFWEGDHLHRHQGWLRLVVGEDGRGSVINVVDIEMYVAAVVAAELSNRFHRSTFEVQAIAARTYAWYLKQTVGTRRAWDLTGTESAQVYGDQARLKRVPRAVRATKRTRGLVCTWDSPAGERIFCTYYSSACGGATQSVAAMRRGAVIPPLAGNVPCPSCQNVSRLAWGPVRLGLDEATTSLRERYPRFAEIGPVAAVRVVEQTPAGRPVRLAIADAERNTIELEAENFRLALDPTGRTIRSTFFKVTFGPQAVVIREGRGFGHGVGLCQHGAEAMARRGVGPAKILRHYYPGARIRRAY